MSERGRPKLNEESKAHTKSFRLYQEQLHALDLMATHLCHEPVSESSIVRAALDHYFQHLQMRGLL
jgi:hypothetical protein